MVSDLVDFLAGRKLLLWGFGKEGRSSYRFLRRHFPAARLTVADARIDAVRAELAEDPLVDFLLQEEVPGRLASFDLVLKSPGIPLAPLGLSPAEADRIAGQADLFLRFAPGRTVAVTGTKGKSTTSHLLRHLLATAFPDVRLGGNIGIPLWDFIEELGPDSITVAELSSYQLEGLHHEAAPHIGVWLNLYEEHLNYHGSFAAYRRAKANLARVLKPGGHLVYRSDDPRLAEGLAEVDLAPGVERHSFGPGTPFPFALRGNAQLPGSHNRLNALAAWTAARILGLPAEGVQGALDSFHALPHRLEPVGTVDGVRYYNDSISTVPEATLAALEALPETDILIAGGMDRGVDYRGLSEALRRSRLRWLILMPETGSILARQLREGAVSFEIAEVATLEEGVALAKREARPGSLCLLSPAASSYHCFRNFEERGEAFRELALGAGAQKNGT